MKVFDGSSTFGSGSSFQVPSLSGPVTSQEQGSPVSPQVFSSIPAPRASGHDEFQQALKDPEFAKAVRGLELCLKVPEREQLRDSGFDSCRVSNAGRLGLRSNSAGGGGGFAPVLVSNSAGEGGELVALWPQVRPALVMSFAIMTPLTMVWRAFDMWFRFAVRMMGQAFLVRHPVLTYLGAVLERQALVLRLSERPGCACNCK